MTNAATDHFTYAPSTNLTHNSSTTSQMTGTTGTFFPGKVISGLPDANSWASVNDGGRMEYPFYVTWKWSDNSNGNSIVVKQSGTYWVEVTTQTGCRLSDTINIVAYEKPMVNLPNNIDTCLSDGELLTLDAGNPGAQYLWDNNYNGRVRVVDQSGTYSVTVTSTNGCKNTDTSIVNIKPNPKSLLPKDTIICEDATIILDPGAEGVSYYWSNGVNTRTNKIDEGGSYVVFITGRNGCILSDTIEVIESGSMPKFDRLQITNQGPRTFKFEITNPQFVTGYHWDFGDGSPIVYQQSPTHTYQVNGNYLVKGYVTSSCGIYYDTMSVHIYSMGVNNLGEDSITLYPNPVDDYLNLALTKSPGNLNLNIYDLLGKKVYSSNLLDNQNQYKIDLRELPEGQYVLILKEDNVILKKSKILIIR